jgi:threonine/homoserine/homoserine lactone efflux protein
MPSAATYLAFISAVIAYQIAPGPDAMLTIGRGVGQGWRIALATVLGMTLFAGLVQLPLLTLGVVSLIRSSPSGYALLQLAGAGYLVWLGIKLLASRSAHLGPDRTTSPGHYSVFAAAREGMICNLSNPSPWLFMLAFLPQFVDASRGSVTAQLFVLGLTQKLTGFAILSLHAVAAGALGSWLSRYPAVVQWQKRFAGATMICLGLRLLVAGDLRTTRA